MGDFMLKHKLAVVAGLATTLALTGAATLPAQAAKPDKYSALGDSYAAGFGAGEAILVGGAPTGQFTGAYPVVLSSGAPFNFRALPGAMTVDIAGQIEGMPMSTKQVTLTVGGNDLGFVDKAKACFLDATGAACEFSLSDGATLTTLPSKVEANIAAIHRAAPAATIYVTGYPLLFQAAPGSGPCVVGTVNGYPYPISESKANQLDTAAVALNSAIEAAIVGPVNRYAKYVDVTGVFTGHGLCGGTASSFINPVQATRTPSGIEVDPTNGPLHPTAAGQQAYAASIRAKGFKG
jgi:lysophospholipase L1-like esterase